MSCAHSRPLAINSKSASQSEHLLIELIYTFSFVLISKLQISTASSYVHTRPYHQTVSIVIATNSPLILASNVF